MKTKKQIWEYLVHEVLTWKQYNQVIRTRASMSFDDGFTAALNVSKSKRVRQLCLAGHYAPITITPEFNRSMISVIPCNDFAIKTYRAELRLVS